MCAFDNQNPLQLVNLVPLLWLRNSIGRKHSDFEIVKLLICLGSEKSSTVFGIADKQLSKVLHGL